MVKSIKAADTQSKGWTNLIAEQNNIQAHRLVTNNVASKTSIVTEKRDS